MKTNEILHQLESIDKNDLIVKILTENKNSSNTQHVFQTNTGCQFFTEVDLQFVAFGTAPKQEFAIKSKNIELIFFKNRDRELEEITKDQKLIIEDFFKNYLIPDLHFTNPVTANKVKTTA